jgi:hypothetical protein
MLKDNISTHVWANEKRRRDDSDVATDMIYSVASSLSWSKSIFKLETCMRIESPYKLLHLLKGEHLEQASKSQPAPISPRSNPYIPTWLKISGSPKYPHHDCMDHRW